MLEANKNLKKDGPGKRATKIQHGQCITCKYYTDPHVGIIPYQCKERFHPTVLEDCNNAKKKSGKKEKFRETYDRHMLTPINILQHGCPEYEAIE